jgi:hypothetical protein
VDTWWDLGEGSGYQGDELQLYAIDCAFCESRGNFQLEHRATRKHAQRDKTLYFDLYRCANCANYIQVFWSPSGGYFSGGGLHAYRTVPWRLGGAKPSDHWPKPIARFWEQASKSLQTGSWDAAALMGRSALQAAMFDQEAKGRTLLDQVDDLAGKGLLSPTLKDWAHEVRLLGNSAAHPSEDPPTVAEDAKDAIQFLTFLLEVLYDVPANIAAFRKRRNSA